MARYTKPYIDPDLSPVDLAWVCGFLEGEGSFGAYETNKKPSKKYARVQCSNTDLECIERLKALLGGNVYKQKPREGKPHYKPIYMWSLNASEQAKGVMRLMQPYMSTRRQAQIDVVLASS